MTEHMYATHFENAAWHNEHHVPDLNCVGKIALAELIQKRGFKVVLGREGADEHFSSYPFFEADFLREVCLFRYFLLHCSFFDCFLLDSKTDSILINKKEDDTWPASQWKRSTRAAALVAKEAKEFTFLKGAPTVIKGQGSAVVREMLNGTSIATLLSWITTVDFASWTLVHKPLSTQDTIANNIDGRISELIRTRWHPLHTAQYVWSKGPLANLILTCLGDKAEMAYGVEGRPPLLDHILTEYVNNIPPSLKIK